MSGRDDQAGLVRHGQSTWNLESRFTGIPLVYELNDRLEAPRHYYLTDEEKVRAATASVASELTAGRAAS